MELMTENQKKAEKIFDSYWEEFQLVPWKWVDILFKNPRIILISIVFFWGILAIITFIPDNPWFGPVTFEYIWYLDSNKILILIHYPSISILLLGWAIVIFLAIEWGNKIPRLFNWLWDSKRLSVKNGKLHDVFELFLRDYQAELLKLKGPLLICLGLFIIIAGLVYWAGVYPFIYNYFTLPTAIVFYLIFLLVYFWLFLIGLFIWVLYITSKFIREMTKRFDVEIQISHPDGCGGLKLIGDFFFDAAMPLIIGGLILVAVSTMKLDIDSVLPILANLLIFAVVGPVAIIAVFWPLWDIHVEMVESKQNYKDVFSLQLRELEREIQINTTEKGDLGKAKAAKEKLEIFKVLHPDNYSDAEWPFKFTTTMLGLLSPQILQTIINFAGKFYSTLF